MFDPLSTSLNVSWLLDAQFLIANHSIGRHGILYSPSVRAIEPFRDCVVTAPPRSPEPVDDEVAGTSAPNVTPQTTPNASPQTSPLGSPMLTSVPAIKPFDMWEAQRSPEEVPP